MYETESYWNIEEIKKMNKAYNSNKLLQNNTTRFAFLEDRFETNSGRGSTVIKYDELYTVLETDTNFYLFISNKQAYNIIKSNCSEELIQFLKGLIK